MTESGAVSQATIRTECPPRINDLADYSGSSEIMCGVDRGLVSLALLSPTVTPCPAGTQDDINSMYSACDGGADWETEKAAWKNWVESKGCAAGPPPPPPAVATVAHAQTVTLTMTEYDECGGSRHQECDVGLATAGSQHTAVTPAVRRSDRARGGRCAAS